MRIDWDSGTIKRDIGIVGSWSPPGLLEQEQGRQQWPREKCQWGAQRFGSWPARNQSINQWMYSYHLVSIYLEVKNSQPKPGTTPGTKPTKSGLGSTQSWRWLKQQYWDGFTATYKMHQHAIYIYTYTNKYIVRGRVQKEIYRRLSDMVTLGSRLTISNHTQEW